MEAKLTRMTAVELEGYLGRLAVVTRVVRWNGVPMSVEDATRRAIELDDHTAVAAHGLDVYAVTSAP